MKLKFLHDSMMFDRETAKEVQIKKGQTVEIDDLDAPAFLSGPNPRAEVVSKEKIEPKAEAKKEPVIEAKAKPGVTKKAKPVITKKAKRK